MVGCRCEGRSFLSITKNASFKGLSAAPDPRCFYLFAFEKTTPRQYQIRLAIRTGYDTISSHSSPPNPTNVSRGCLFICGTSPSRVCSAGSPCTFLCAPPWCSSPEIRCRRTFGDVPRPRRCGTSGLSRLPPRLRYTTPTGARIG